MNAATIARATPLREPATSPPLPEPTWEEAAAVQSILSVLHCAVDGIVIYRGLRIPRGHYERLERIAEYLMAWMSWYVRARAECYSEPCGPDPAAPEDQFEAWVIKRWLRQIRSEAFQNSADYEMLRARWEREG